MEELPQQIGRYRVDRLLGSGSMGNVYLAHDADLDRQVAIKTLRDLVLDAEMRDVFLSRFQNEARAAARLHHPNIVQIFDVGDDPRVGPYLVFEYVPGHTLKQVLKKEGPRAADSAFKEHVLNFLGKEGWELVDMEIRQQNLIYFYLKRRTR